MVREVVLLPEFTPGFVEVKNKIPKFQYGKSLPEELRKKTLTKQECIDLLKCMLLIRDFEEMICELRENKGKYGSMKYLYIGATHLSIGQEAVSTGAISSILPNDYITSNHRGHGDALAKGYFTIKHMDDSSLISLITKNEEISSYLGLKTKGKTHEELIEEALRLHLFRAIAELFGKKAGYCRGRGGGMHIADFSKGHLGANAIVGGSMGMAVGSGIASRYFEDKRVTLCFAGDGAFNNGIAHETMNMATMAQFTNGLMNKKFGIPVIFAIVNNQYGMTGQQRGEVTGIEFLAERSFGYNKEGMHAEIVNGMDVLALRDATKRAIELTREGEGPVLLEFWCYRFKGHNVKDKLERKEDETYRALRELEVWEKVDPLKTFPEKLIKEKVISTEDFEEFKKETRARNEEMAVRAAEAKSPDPKKIYFGLFSHTSSGKVPEKFKDIPILKKPEFLEREPDMEITYREAIIEALFQEMRRDRRVVLWGEDIADYGGAYGATRGLLEIFGRERIFNTAISEAAIIGSGAGAALRGLRPVVEIMYIDFVLQALDQLGNQAVKWTYMSGGQATLPLTIRTTIGGGKGYAGQHSQSLEAILAHLPGLKIAVPSDAYDAKGILASAIRDDNPVVFIEHQNLYREPLAKSKVPKEDYLIPLGKAKIKREANPSKESVTLVAWSSMVPIALKSAEKLSKEDIEVEVIDIRFLYPLDIDTIVTSVQKTGRGAIVHQAIQFMGFGAEIGMEIQEKAFDYLDAPVVRIAAPNTPPPSSPVLEKAFLPNEEDIITSIKRLVR
ncbi:pyruvate dehydrogenase [Patescibacteria group bacterium]|nr:pyruvate dehydrogenase [Patescibacteria group bacterium]